MRTNRGEGDQHMTRTEASEQTDPVHASIGDFQPPDGEERNVHC